jgi:NADH:ubiquinone oxidoreductase subunit K
MTTSIIFVVFERLLIWAQIALQILQIFYFYHAGVEVTMVYAIALLLFKPCVVRVNVCGVLRCEKSKLMKASS